MQEKVGIIRQGQQLQEAIGELEAFRKRESATSPGALAPTIPVGIRPWRLAP